MTAVRSGRPGLLVLLIPAAVLSFSSCRSTSVADIPKPVENPCVAHPHPPVNNMRPIICVDDSQFPTLTVSPPEAHAYHGMTIQWWTISGTGSLGISFKEDDPVDYVACLEGKGHCRATARDDAGRRDPYPYAVTLTRGNQVGILDPTIIIDTN
jgi:hypothetical protein